MNDLIFHIGLTKTGSSFLQRKVFLGKMHTLSRSVDWTSDSKSAAEFQDFFLRESPHIWSEKAGKDFFLDLFGDVDDTALISHESLFSHIPFLPDNGSIEAEPELLAQRLKNINDFCCVSGRVKVFFFFRMQADWLASMYAHVAYALEKPSQVDFEQRVRNLLALDNKMAHILEYDRLYQCLSDMLGTESVLAIPYEKFSDAKVWRSIEAFTGISGLYDRIPFGDTSVNTKRVDDGKSWHTSRDRNGILGFQVSTETKRFLKRTVGGTALVGILDRWRPKSKILMSEELREEVTGYYKTSNERLSILTGYDLGRYGYY